MRYFKVEISTAAAFAASSGHVAEMAVWEESAPLTVTEAGDVSDRNGNILDRRGDLGTAFDWIAETFEAAIQEK